MTIKGGVGQQLSMFATARDLHRLPSSDVGNYSSRSNMWRAKQRDNDRDGLSQHVAEEGVHIPVEVMHGYKETEIWDGHHRLHAQFRADPERLVPIEHQTPEHYTVRSTAETVTPGYDDHEERRR